MKDFEPDLRPRTRFTIFKMYFENFENVEPDFENCDRVLKNGSDFENSENLKNFENVELV